LIKERMWRKGECKETGGGKKREWRKVTRRESKNPTYSSCVQLLCTVPIPVHKNCMEVFLTERWDVQGMVK
jgi:hypothetical protein